MSGFVLYICLSALTFTDFCKKRKKKRRKLLDGSFNIGRYLAGPVVSHLCKDAVYKSNEKFFSVACCLVSELASLSWLSSHKMSPDLLFALFLY